MALIVLFMHDSVSCTCHILWLSLSYFFHRGWIFTNIFAIACTMASTSISVWIYHWFLRFLNWVVCPRFVGCSCISIGLIKHSALGLGRKRFARMMRKVLSIILAVLLLMIFWLIPLSQLHILLEFHKLFHFCFAFDWSHIFSESDL